MVQTRASIKQREAQARFEDKYRLSKALKEMEMIMSKHKLKLGDEQQAQEKIQSLILRHLSRRKFKKALNKLKAVKKLEKIVTRRELTVALTILSKRVKSKNDVFYESSEKEPPKAEEVELIKRVVTSKMDDNSTEEYISLEQVDPSHSESGDLVDNLLEEEQAEDNQSMLKKLLQE